MTDADAERALLGLLLAQGGAQILARRVMPAGLEPGMLYVPRHQRVLDAMIAVHDEGGHPDPVTVSARLVASGLDRARVDQAVTDLLLGAGDLSAVDQYVTLIREDWVWRQRQAAAHELATAVQERDSDKLAAAEQMLVAAVDNRAVRDPEPQALAHRFLDRLEHPDTRRWPFPLPRLNKLTRGGMRPGQVTFLSGATNHGKSPFLDQCLESAARAGASCRLYMTEMTEHERMARTAARNTGVSLDWIMEAKISDTIARKLTDWAAKTGPAFAMEEAAGWTAAEIARDARYRRADVIGIDLLDELPLLPGMSRRETAEESYKILIRLAMQAECHVIVAGHLNRARLTGRADVPIPTLGDIRESGQIANGSSFVVFVWREQEETGRPLPEGLVVLAKARGGEQGATHTYFDGALQKWLQADVPTREREAA